MREKERDWERENEKGGNKLKYIYIQGVQDTGKCAHMCVLEFFQQIVNQNGLDNAFHKMAENIFNLEKNILIKTGSAQNPKVTQSENILIMIHHNQAFKNIT